MRTGRGRALSRVIACAVALTTRAVIGAPCAGDLDETFGAGGFVISSAPGYPVAVAPQPDGRLIVLTGNLFPNTLLRFDTAGRLDPTFGESGAVHLVPDVFL